MRVTENRLRSIIRSVISENMSNEFVPPGSYGNSERQMTLEEMEKIFEYYLENQNSDKDKLDGDDEVLELQEKHEEYLKKIKAFINDLIERYGRNYGKKQGNDVR